MFPRKELTPKSLVILVTGLLVLAGLTVWQVVLGGRTPAGPVTVISGETMGTYYTVQVVGRLSADRVSRLTEAIDGALADVNGMMSTYDPESDLSRFNASRTTEAVALPAAVIELLALALEVSEASGGAYDVTVGPLVNAWGFGPDGPTSRPTEGELAALRERVGYGKLVVDETAGTARKLTPDLYVDLSSIAKGHGVDVIAELLEDEEVEDFMVEIGGEVRTAGLNREGVAWRVGIQLPLSDGARRPERIVPLSNWSMATSGDYQNFFVEDGRRYSHLIDPRTGWPVPSSLASVTVIHERCAEADAYSTALAVLGPEEGLALADVLGLKALFLLRGEDGTFTARASGAFEGEFGAVWR